MGKDFTRKYTVELDLDIKKAPEQLKKLTSNIIEISNNLGKASDKFAVFKELIDYLSQIDAKIASLKASAPDLFNQIFGTNGVNIDAAIKKAMEPIIQSPEKITEALKSVQSKISDLQNRQIKGGSVKIAEIRQVATELQDLYRLAGKEAPSGLNDLFAKGTRASLENIVTLEKALKDFSVEWDKVVQKTQTGFSSGSGGGFDGLSDEVKAQVTTLEDQIKKLEDLQSRFKSVVKTLQSGEKNGFSGISDQYKIDLTVESVQKLIEEYDLLEQKIKSGDKASATYYADMVRMSEVILTLKRALKDVRADDSIKQLFMAAPGGSAGNMLGKLSTYANVKSGGMIKQILGDSSDTGIITMIKDAKAQLESLTSVSDNSTNSIIQQNQNLANSYIRLKQLLEEYAGTIKQLDVVGLSEAQEDSLLAKQERIQKNITKMASTPSLAKGIGDILYNMSGGEIGLEKALEQISNLLGIQIPQNASKTGQTISSSLQTAQQQAQTLSMSYDELSQKVKNYYAASDIGDFDKSDKILSNIFQLSSASEEVQGKIITLLNSFESSTADQAISEIAKLLGVQIPQGAEMAKQALSSVSQAEQQIGNAQKQKVDTVTPQIEQQNTALQTQVGLQSELASAAEKKKEAEAQTSNVSTVETQQYEQLRAKLIEVTDAINTKTQAFQNEATTVTSSVDQEIASLQKLQEFLTQIKALAENIFANIQSTVTAINGLKLPGAVTAGATTQQVTTESDKAALSTILTTVQNTEQIVTSVQTDLKTQGANISTLANAQTQTGVAISELLTAQSNLNNNANGPYALEATLGSTNEILGQILSVVQSGGSLTGFTSALQNIVTQLQKIATDVSGQRTYKSTTNIATNRISDSEEYAKIQSVALGSLGDRAIESKVTGIKALKDGVVQVTGVLKTAEDAWESFTVRVTQSGEAEKLTITANKELTEQAKQFSSNLQQACNSVSEYESKLAQLKTAPEGVASKLQELKGRLTTVTNGQELVNWVNDWNAVTASIDKAITKEKEAALAAQNFDLNAILKSANKSYGALKIDPLAEQLPAHLDEAKKKYQELQERITQCMQNGTVLTEQEINQLKAMARELENTAKQYGNLGAKKAAAYGTAQVTNAMAKHKNMTDIIASNSELSESSVVDKLYKQYNAVYNALIAKQKEFNATTKPTQEQIAAFKALTQQFNDAGRALNDVVSASQKLAQGSSGGTPFSLLKSELDMSKETDRMEALRQAVASFAGSRAVIGNFKKDFTELDYTVKNGDGTFTEMTATLNAARTAIYSTAGETKKATTAFSSFFNELKGKARSLSAYLITMGSFYRVISQIRKGVGYVKEIDSALTELKKVTDETDATYGKFLQTMSKTAGVVGSTVKDLTSSASDWARLNI